MDLPLKLPETLRRPAVYAGAAAAILAVALAVRYQVTRPPGDIDLPAFDHLEPAAMKDEFFAFLRPIARYHNERIAEDRAWLLKAAKKDSLGWFEQRRFERLAERYRIDLAETAQEEAFRQLKRRVDVVPEALILIQAAKESGWGRSRFAREGNTLFGERCYEPGCGIVPDARQADARHEVETFPTVHATVGSYIHNLNTHGEYAGFRRARQNLRNSDQELTGTALAAHLGSYSERGDAYVQEIVSMIRQNDLEAN